MKILIAIEYFVNLIILLCFYMHMFQLNSYFFKKHLHWMKKNYKKIIFSIFLVLLTNIFLLFDNFILNILIIFILGFSIFYNFPKKKAKIEFKITNRVKRMFFTEILLILFFIAINFKEYIFIKLCILNILSPVMCFLANFINYPFESMNRKHYINEAKKIISDMPDLIVIGVTGSYGKTSVKNFLEKILEKKYEVLTTPKNYNTTMGVVKTIRENLRPTHQIFICEMGATKPNDIKEICDIVKPKYGIITSIGPQHLESFKSIENIINTKFELADSVKENDGLLFLNYNNDYLAKHSISQDCVTYGIDDDKLNYNAFNIRSSSNGSSFTVFDKSSNKEINFNTKLIGKHNVINIVGAIAISNYLGISLADIVPQVKLLKSVPHRLELISNNNFNIIDDSYNSNPVSSKSALDTLAQFDGTKIIVTPGLIELGDDEEKYNYEFGRYSCNVCDYIFLVNSRPSKFIFDGISSTNFDKKRVFFVDNPNEAVNQILNSSNYDNNYFASDEINLTKTSVSNTNANRNQALVLKNTVTILLENDLPDNYNL